MVGERRGRISGSTRTRPNAVKVVIALQEVSMRSGLCGSCNLNPAIYSCAFVDEGSGFDISYLGNYYVFTSIRGMLISHFKQSVTAATG
jgi:hypothetical protein